MRELSAVTDMTLVFLFPLIISFAMTPSRLPEGYGCESKDCHFWWVAIYNDAAWGIIWVENQVLFGANQTVMGKACFEQRLWDMTYAKVKHYYRNNGFFFSAEEYPQE
jgi:hypothetical protein